MKIIKSIVAGLLLFVASVAGAQIGSSVVTAQGAFTLPSGGVLTLTAQIVSCGNAALPLYNGLPISLTPNQTPSAPFTANSSQVVTMTLPGNDKIVCGNQSYSLYALTWNINGFAAQPTTLYRFTDATSLTLSNLVPINFVPPVLGNAAGALCPAATPIFTGFSSTYQIQCAAAVSNLSAALSITGGTLQGNLIIPASFGINSYNDTAMFRNGTPQADQFAGADFCAKLHAAEVYAIGANIREVDASHFTSPQSCASDPFHDLVADQANVKLKVDLPAAVINYTTPIKINFDGLFLQGAGRFNTVFAYTGACSANQIAWTLSGDTTTNYVQFDTFKDFSVVTTATSGCNGYDFYIQEAHRNDFENMSFWGNQYGFVTAGAVTDTFYKLHVSNQDAVPATWYTYQIPQHGFYFGSGAGGDGTTDGTIIDFAAEGIAGIGVECYYCVDMHFSAGTSESNVQGITLDAQSKFNVFTALDNEANSQASNGNDFYDVGGENIILGGIYASVCSGCNAVYQAGSVGNDISIGDANSLTGIGGLFNILGNNSKLGVGGLGTTSAYIISASQVGTTGVMLAPIITSNSAAPTFSPGTGITSITCVTIGGNTCSSMRGRILITNASATTAQILGSVLFASNLGVAPVCTITQEAGTAYYGLYISNDTGTSFTFNSTNTISGITQIYAQYYCSR